MHHHKKEKMINKSVLLVPIILIINSCVQKKESAPFTYQHNVDILNDSTAIAGFQSSLNNSEFTVINQDTSKYVLRSEDQNDIYASISYCLFNYKPDTINWQKIPVKRELQLTIKTNKPKPLKQDKFFVEMWSFNSMELAASYFELLKVIDRHCDPEFIWTYPILFRNKILILYVKQPLSMTKRIDEDATQLLYRAMENYLDGIRDLKIDGVDIVKRFEFIDPNLLQK